MTSYSAIACAPLSSKMASRALVLVSLMRFGTEESAPTHSGRWPRPSKGRTNFAFILSGVLVGVPLGVRLRPRTADVLRVWFVLVDMQSHLLEHP